MKINLLTVCVDKYPMEYAEKIIKHFCELSNLEITPYCITDRPELLSSYINPIQPKVNVSGWWNKVLLFDPDMPAGWNLYLDLDIVIFENFDDEIMYAIDNTKQVSCVSDAIKWMGERFNSSLMIYQTGAMKGVYLEFIENYNKLEGRAGGDQVWIGPKLSNILYLDEKYPLLKRNFKFQFASRVGNNFHVPHELPAGIKMIDFGGKPKPHQLTTVPYIYDNWHMV